MRVTQILSSTAYNRKLSSKAAPKQNVSFGLIEKENRDKIIAHLPEKDEELRQWHIANMDKNKGTIVRWGGKDCPRGLIYADLIPEHIEKSPIKYFYSEIELEHLEKLENFEDFAAGLDIINTKEMKAKKGIEQTPSASSDSDYDPTAGDNTMKAYDLYGAP